MRVFILLFIVATFSNIRANTITVGSSGDFTTLVAAAGTASPGDTLLILDGVYTQRENITLLKGTANAWIYILAETEGQVIYQGESEAWHLSDCEYLFISGFVFEQQTANGVNIDDGGSYDTPTHHIIIENCIFRDMNASENNDLLKLSGLDTFEIRNCSFINGGAGGSGIDMVGCHVGLIESCYLDSAGSSGIQAKGGSQFIRIERNILKNMSQRALNLGGSTGSAFFRPQGINFEAADLQVYSNLFYGSWAPIAYVGCVRVEVVNNTIYLPQNWIIRILQETTTPGFLQCGDNTFSNNIVVRNSSLSTDINTGPNTLPTTFTFSNNLWFHTDDSLWSGPSLPVTEQNGIVQQDPLLTDPSAEDLSLTAGSPAIGMGLNVTDPVNDYENNPFNNPRSIGAYEGNAVLPVSLVQFEARLLHDERVHLTWTTGYEENVDRILVLRLNQTGTWDRLGLIKPTNSFGGSTYDYFDPLPLTGSNYYQLHFIDYDGSKQVSGIRQIWVQPMHAKIRGYPNPTREILHLNNLPLNAESLTLNLYDGSGARVDRIQIKHVQDGKFPWRFSSKLPSGKYSLQVVSKGKILDTLSIVIID